MRRDARRGARPGPEETCPSPARRAGRQPPESRDDVGGRRGSEGRGEGSQGRLLAGSGVATPARWTNVLSTCMGLCVVLTWRNRPGPARSGPARPDRHNSQGVASEIATILRKGLIQPDRKFNLFNTLIRTL